MRGSGSKRGKKRQVTITDLAEHLDISKATVSLALNDSPLVADTTKQRVIEAAEHFGYRPNYFGARLSKGKSDVIGLFILGGEEQKCNWALPSSWMFYNPILKAVSEELSRHDYRLHLEVISIEQATKHEVIANTIQEGSLDGMLLVVQDATDYDFLSIVEETQFPFVVLNAKVSESISSVKIDNELGARNVVKYLMELGHQRIAYISGPSKDLNAIERRTGFIEAHRDVGIDVTDGMIQYGDWQRGSGEAITEQILQMSQRPTAIFCANDHMAVGSMQALKQAGVQIPGEMSLVGFDDTEMGQIVTPNLTSVRQSLELMGELGASEVLRQISEDGVPVTHMNLEPLLIIRDSAGVASVKEPKRV